MGKPKITVVGSNMVDLITYTDRMPKEGETIEAPRFEMGFGGKGANQAVAAALLGAEVSMVTKVGDDLFGPNTKRNFERYGIDTTFVESVPGVSSGVAPIFVDRSSHNSILIIKGANAHLLPKDVDRAKGKILASDMVIMQLEVPLETVYHTIALCATKGVPVILNPAPADPALDARKILGVSLFVPNETELQTLTRMPTGMLDDVKAAGRSLLKKGIATIIVTLGDKGCLLVTADAETLVPAFRVKSVDTTGAGDAFIGCFAVSYAETGDIGRAMEMANRYAALSTTKPGTQKSFLDRAAFEAAMA
ncbi:MAG TPA: ribokinase [Spirochaetia bacterium]|nr:ribokinase [Spirochaetia bacterium]